MAYDLVRTFKLRGVDRQEVTVYVYRERNDTPGALGPLSTLMLADGSRVSLLGPGKYMVAGTGELLDGEDPEPFR